jgi:SAM-dependent methyltransferase
MTHHQLFTSPVVDADATVNRDAGAPSVLSPAYYQRLFDLEEAHGWQRGMMSFNGALLAPLVDGRRGLRVLDSGCGTGGLMSWLRGRGAHVVGIDVAPEGLRLCQRRGHRRLARGSAQELPFADESFDLVVCTDVLQHLPNPPGDAVALAEVRRVLRPGGYLYARTNSGCGDRVQVERSRTYRKYTRTELMRRAALAGFEVKRCTYANAIPALPFLLRRRFATLAPAENGQALHHHGEDSHGSDPGLSLTVRRAGWRWVDTLLAALLRSEAWLVSTGGAGLNLPFGDSLLVLAQRSNDIGHT